MNEETRSIQAYELDAQWLDKVKRKLKKIGKRDVIRSLRKLISRHKMEDELK